MALSTAEIFGLGAANSINQQLQDSKAPKWLQAIWNTTTGTFNALADIELRQFEIEQQRAAEAEADKQAKEADDRRAAFFGIDAGAIDQRALIIGGVGLVALILLLRS